MTRRIALVFALTLLAAPAGAQTYEPPPADPPPEDSLQQGLESLMDNLRQRAQPSLDRLEQDLGGLAQRLGPVLGELGDLMDDVKNYQAPERLENGDILIRRRVDAPPPPEMGQNLRDMMRPAPDAAPDAGSDSGPDSGPGAMPEAAPQDAPDAPRPFGPDDMPSPDGLETAPDQAGSIEL